MNVLYVTSSFHKKGSASVRNVSLVNGLIENGATVDVLTQDWPENMIDYDLKKNINGDVKIYYDRIKIIDLYFSKMKVDKKSNKKNYFFSLTKSILKNLYYFPDIDKEWISNFNKSIKYENYDLVVSSSDTKTSHLVAMEIRKLNPKLKWFQIWGDPWVDDEGTKGIKKILAYYYEKKLLEKSDKAFYVSEPTLNDLKKKYPKASSKMYYLGRSYMNEILKIDFQTQSQAKEIIFSYIGSIYYGRNIDPLVNSITNFNSNKVNKQKIILNVYGVYDEGLVSKYKDLDYINFYGFIQYNHVEKVIKNSDVLVFMSNPTSSHQIPGKLFDYFGTNLPILTLVESKKSSVTNFIEKTERCIVMENDSELIDLRIVVQLTLNKRYNILPQYSKQNVAKTLLNNF